MKGMLFAIVLATLGYSGWWAWAAWDMRASVEDWFADRSAEGWEARYADLTVRGFPNRTDLTLTDPVIRTPDLTVGWDAPFFQVLSLSYKPGHKILVWPDRQEIDTPDGPVTVTSDGLRASLIHDGSRIQRSNLEAVVLNVAGAEASVAMAGVNAALQRIELSEAEYRLALSVDRLAVTQAKVTGTMIPEAFASLRADMSIEMEAPLATDDVPPNPVRVDIRTAEVTYGALMLKLAGNADLDEAGRATGKITVRAENWRTALETAQETGDLPPAVAEGLVDILSLLSSFSGREDTLDVTLRLSEGTVLLGPLPIGELPSLHWR